MNIHRSAIALILTCLLAGACGGESSDDPSGQTKRKPGSTKTKKDRGEAQMLLGEKDWTSSSAKARVRGSRLTVRASRMERSGDVMLRDELHLAVDEFKGPGDYTSAMSGSRFIRVGLNTGTAAAAGDDDAKVAKEVTKALTGAKHLMLIGAKITVTQVSDTEVSGTFTWSPPTGTGDAITNGSFRAIVRK